MRAVVQRVSQAHVDVGPETVGAIDRGLLVLLGVEQGDEAADGDSLADKVLGLRIFPDAQGKMNLDLRQAGGAALVVSQFTLLGDCRKGRRPAFTDAASPEEAKALYERFCERLAAAGIRTARGVFAADMQVHLTNDGPVTLLLDSRRRF